MENNNNIHIYVAGPLFNEMEKHRNILITLLLEQNGFTTYLPQKDGGMFNDGAAVNDIAKQVFEADINALEKCNFMVATVAGHGVDDGTAVEIGYFLAQKKPIVLFTDGEKRRFARSRFNLMIETGVLQICDTFEELQKYMAIYNSKVTIDAVENLI